MLCTYSSALWRPQTLRSIAYGWPWNWRNQKAEALVTLTSLAGEMFEIILAAHYGTNPSSAIMAWRSLVSHKPGT
jgi:hypothetical protein